MRIHPAEITQDTIERYLRDLPTPDDELTLWREFFLQTSTIKYFQETRDTAWAAQMFSSAFAMIDLLGKKL